MTRCPRCNGYLQPRDKILEVSFCLDCGGVITDLEIERNEEFRTSRAANPASPDATKNTAAFIEDEPLYTGAAFLIGWLMLDGEHDEFDMRITGRNDS